MDESLQRESERLARSWARHDPAWLREYLVAGVEDPRLNVQSVLSRHFLVRNLTGERFEPLMAEERRFAAVMNWLVDFVSRAGDAEPLAVLLHALRRGADNAEGCEIPLCVRRAFANLPTRQIGWQIPNYIEGLLAHSSFEHNTASLHQPTLNTFQVIWHTALSQLHTLPRRSFRAKAGAHSPLRTLLEPACGSANDYRFLDAFGVARLFDYTGFDLAEKNVRNARDLFPDIHFEVANVFDIPSADQSFDDCIVHDLFEHLSLEGLEIAMREVCRVTRHRLCLGFFQMDEIPDHISRPVDDYHINLLSVDRMRTLLAHNGFSSQVIHIATFLRSQFACEFTHNPFAYTFLAQSHGDTDEFTAD